LIACNKHDLAPGLSLPEMRHPVIQTSALTGEGIAEVRRALLALMASAAPSRETALLTNIRQQQAVSASLLGLGRAREAVAAAIPHEMVLLDLYEALEALDGLTGVTTNDDILRLIFSTFCIGK
jgi:tRNA modification GTPase